MSVEVLLTGHAGGHTILVILVYWYIWSKTITYIYIRISYFIFIFYLSFLLCIYFISLVRISALFLFCFILTFYVLRFKGLYMCTHSIAMCTGVVRIWLKGLCWSIVSHILYHWTAPHTFCSFSLRTILVAHVSLSKTSFFCVPFTVPYVCTVCRVYNFYRLWDLVYKYNRTLFTCHFLSNDLFFCVVICVVTSAYF